MKKMIVRMIACVLSLVCLFGLTACGNTADNASDTPAAVCFVIGGHDAGKGLNLSAATVRQTAYGAIRSFGYVTVVSVDGSPDMVFQQDYQIADYFKNAPSTKLDIDAENSTAELETLLNDVVADNPEADYLSALRLAARSMETLTGYGSKTVVVAGTGLSTAGIMDYRNNLLAAEPSEIVKILQEQQYIPNLNGVHVIWLGMGDVAAPQTELSPAQVENMWQTYEMIVTAGGGTFERCNVSPTAHVDKAYPKMSTVDVSAVAPIVFEPAMFTEEPVAETADAEPAATEPAVLFREPVALTEEQVRFVGNSAAFLDPAEAGEALQPIADYLKSNPETKLLLCGTTAGDVDSEYTIELSAARADAVKNALVAYGVESERLITCGLGSEKDPWHIWNLGEGDAASVNRKVVLIDAGSSTACEILKTV